MDAWDRDICKRQEERDEEAANWSLYESTDDKFDKEFSEMRRIEMMWHTMHVVASGNPELRELMDRAIVFYELIKK